MQYRQIFCLFANAIHKNKIMKAFKFLLLLLFGLTACRNNTTSNNPTTPKNTSDFTIAFGSCNNQTLPNNLWNEISKNKPNVWVWGGDIIYTDTEDMEFMAKNYKLQKNNTAYASFIKNTDVLATWDDHDYGLNDGGVEYKKKQAAQQLFLDFIDIPKTDTRRKQEGIYFSKDYTVHNTTVKIILLDSRYFRTALSPDTESKKRYKPNTYGIGTMLGAQQWAWLKSELQNSTAAYNVIVSSIQFLSGEHGFESWSTMPHEIDKLENLLKSTQAKNTLILSGDRHISEISKKEVTGLPYPLLDFTSSGLTHAYTGFSGEPNKYRLGNVLAKKSFGLLKFDFKNNVVRLEMRGKNNILYQSHVQQY